MAVGIEEERADANVCFDLDCFLVKLRKVFLFKVLQQPQLQQLRCLQEQTLDALSSTVDDPLLHGTDFRAILVSSGRLSDATRARSAA